MNEVKTKWVIVVRDLREATVRSRWTSECNERVSEPRGGWTKERSDWSEPPDMSERSEEQSDERSERIVSILKMRTSERSETSPEGEWNGVN